MNTRDNTVWLRGSGCVVGFDIDDLNNDIDLWNKHIAWYVPEFTDFWDWLTWFEGEPLYGFDYLWNNHVMSKVHTIKKAGR